MSRMPWEGPVNPGAGHPQPSFPRPTAPGPQPCLQREMLSEVLAQAADSEATLQIANCGVSAGQGDKK